MPHESDQDPFSAQKMTWAALLARWVEFARSALALPDDEDGNRMRQSIADIITLQAVWFALAEINQLNNKERALGLDRAEILIEDHSRALMDRWQDQLPQALVQLISDARQRLAEATA